MTARPGHEFSNGQLPEFMRQTGLVLSDLFVRRDWDF
jgi:hypothetical protein